MTRNRHAPDHVSIRGARVHNLRGIDVDVPLGKLVGIAGVSGSGKSSLALGVLYAEGSRRYLEALSTYTRRRMTTAAEADVEYVDNVPASLALHQRPAVPGIRSTFGTSTELLNSLRLMYSRLGSHLCPNGHHVPPSPNVALDLDLTCPECGVSFMGPSAESFAFNSEGACPTCGGTGVVRTVDESTLVPDETISIDDGAVAPWNSLMWSLMTDVCRAMGVRTDVPFNQLTDHERDIVFHGPAEKKHILYHSRKTNQAGELDFTYYNAVYTVENALAKVKDDKGMKRVERFLRQDTCPDCGGSRLAEHARGTLLRGIGLAEASSMSLDDLIGWVDAVPGEMPDDMRRMARSIADQFLHTAKRLLDLGLGYLSLDRAGSTLSTGERQRVQLARAVRNRTTGVLYVLDEPSIGLHPSNVDGLLGMIDDLLDHGNSVVLVDHDARVLKACDWLIEMGPGAGEHGGTVLCEGTVGQVASSPRSLVGPFLSDGSSTLVREPATSTHMFDDGRIHLSTGPLHTVHDLDLDIPKGRLIAVTGVSGSGKTTLILESLVPALQAAIAGRPLPGHVKSLDAGGVTRVNLIDATPIGTNVRSTVATYSNVMDDLRRAYAAAPDAKAAGLRMGDFSYNTGTLRCPTCDGTGQITMDVQFLPDVSITCPDCGGSRYSRRAASIVRTPKARRGRGSDTSGDRGLSLPELMALTVDQAMERTRDVRKVHERLATLSGLGLGYLTLGEATPALSGGEAQRLKLASEMGHAQDDALFVFDEPTIGLHPLDVQVLIGVFQRLLDAGATVVVIEHDLDMIANADYVIDMGPGGGLQGGHVVATGTPSEVAANGNSLTGRYIGEVLRTPANAAEGRSRA